MADLQRVWTIAIGIVSAAVNPLLAVWPKVDQRSAIMGEWIRTSNGYEAQTVAGKAQMFRVGGIWQLEINGEISTIGPRARFGVAEDIVERTVEGLQRIPMPGAPPAPTVTEAQRAISRMLAESTAVPPPTPSALTPQTIASQMDWAGVRISEAIGGQNLEVMIGSHAGRVDRFNRADLERVIGIDLRKNLPSLQGDIDQWIRANIELIESGTHGHPDGRHLKGILTDIEETVSTAHTQGLRVEEISKQLQNRFSVSRSRANLIARDQVLKLNSQITRQRQMDVGITEYIWVTSRDERVRPGHRDLDGTVQQWDAPPDTGRGHHNHPGEDYQCRCVARPKPPTSDEFGEIPTF